MKKLLLILLYLPFIGLGQQTSPISDANFEQALINLGYDTGIPDGSVPTANINNPSVDYIDVSSMGISDLTGIEDFGFLKYLYCGNNQINSLYLNDNLELLVLSCGMNNLTELDLSTNYYLTYLNCTSNGLSDTLDLTENYNLIDVSCGFNSITNLKLTTTNGTSSLQSLTCRDNLLTYLDLSYYSNLTELECQNNQLYFLDLRGTDVTNMTNQLGSCGVDGPVTYNNNNLLCINTTNVSWANNYWNCVDSWTTFSNLCPYFYGCTDSLACNYDSTANTNNGSCDLPNGCGDPLYLDYDASVDCSDPSACITLIVNGCMDSTACNYIITANVDDGSCVGLLGCIDTTACNYDSLATCSDGSCDLSNGCGDPLYLEYSASVTCSDPSACITLIVNGCMDPTACNYIIAANVDDGSCDLTNGCGDPLYLEYSASVTCSDPSACITLIVNGCMDSTACNYIITANLDDGSCVGLLGCIDTTSCNYDSLATCSDGSCVGLSGCMDPTACNYVAAATCADSSCVGLLGCMDATACNYIAVATCDDGSCYQFTIYITPISNTLNYTILGDPPQASSFLWNTGETTQSIIPTANGIYWLLVEDLNQCIADTADFTVDWMPTDITEISLADLSIFPNPSEDIFNIVFTTKKKQNLQLRIFNILGGEIYKEYLGGFTGKYTKQIMLGKYSHAIYFFEIKTNEGVINRKLILQ